MDVHYARYEENDSKYEVSISLVDDGYYLVTIFCEKTHSYAETAYMSAYVAWCEFCNSSGGRFNWFDVPDDVYGEFTMADLETFQARCYDEHKYPKTQMITDVALAVKRYSFLKEQLEHLSNEFFGIECKLSVSSAFWIHDNEMFNSVANRLKKDVNTSRYYSEAVGKTMISSSFKYGTIEVCNTEEDV